jgi:SAM-dependent methyltransferase
MLLTRRRRTWRIASALAVAGALPFAPHLLARQVAPQRRPDVRFSATPPQVVDTMLQLARVTSADVVYDLGSGDGRIPIAAAQKYGARGVGIEIDLFHMRNAMDNLKKAGVGDRVIFLTQDLFEADISGATVVTLFLLPQLNQRLIPKLTRELRPGSRVVSYMWDMGDQWAPEMTDVTNGVPVYLWTIR